jgi:hypothetical protein
MSTLQMNLNRFGLRADQILGRAEMKRIVGGYVSEEEPFGECMGCETNTDCSSVGKGTCETCTNPKHVKCCSGWHSEQ